MLADGYRDFTDAFGSDDIVAVRERSYASAPQELDDIAIEPNLTQPDWHSPLLELFCDRLSKAPKNVGTVFPCPPLHAHYVSSSIANLRECKDRIAAILHNIDNMKVLDFLHLSKIMRADINYWDPLHFTTEIVQVRMTYAS